MKILYRERVLIHDKRDAIIVADIHLGIEKELRRRGICIKDLTEKIAKELCFFADSYELRKLFVLGDLKHAIFRMTSDVNNFFNIIYRSFDKVYLIPGNHDAPYDDMRAFCEVLETKGIKIDNYFFWHGYTWPAEDFSKARVAYCGHLHPEIEISDVGGIRREACWLVCYLDDSLTKIYNRFPRKLVIMPSFNPFVGSSISTGKGKFPLSKYIKEQRIFLLNGVEI